MSRALYLAKLWAQDAADRARTCDQSVNSRTLYLLSYGGTCQVKPVKQATKGTYVYSLLKYSTLIEYT